LALDQIYERVEVAGSRARTTAYLVGPSSAKMLFEAATSSG
jgi:hypothetical protein